MNVAGACSRAPLRISYLFPQFPVPTETFAVSDIATLRADGHRVVVHTVKPARLDEARRLRASGVPLDLPILRPTLRGALRWPVLLWRSRKTARPLLKLIAARLRIAPGTALETLLIFPRILEIVDEVRRCESDVVHLFWARHAGLVLPLLACENGGPVRSAFVGAYDLTVDDFLVDVALRSTELLFTHAEVNRPYAERKAGPGVRVEVIYRGIPLLPAVDEAERDPAKWMTASALDAAKNVAGVLRTFAAARASRPELKLAIFGDGPEKDRLVELARKLGCEGAVRFMGHASREQIHQAMNRSSVFLLLTKKPSERLPNVVKEALWAGCAIIASRSPGIEELVPDPGIGFVIDPDDQQSVEAAVAAVLTEAAEAAAARQARARAHVAEHFSSERNMRRYVDSWNRKLLSRTPLPEPANWTADPTHMKIQP
jgi:glycosyltransferase involved in cell wall biosynthesis